METETGVMKVAIIHDWLTGMRGGEKCLEVFCELFPDATLFTLVHVKGSVSDTISRMRIKTSFLQKFPDIEKRYRYCLPFMPAAIKSFDLSGCDLILSSSHCVAKGVRPPRSAVHICYCYTPMRYMWDMYGQYFGNSRFHVKMAAGLLRPFLQRWDYESSRDVNYFIAISENIKRKIKACYNRDSEVIYPPVDTDFFTPTAKRQQPTANYYLIVSAFAPYKRIDLAVEAFNKLGLPLRIIGSGQDEKKIKGIAGKNIEILGWADNDLIRESYRNCKALIFPGDEDFGIVPVEAQACGTPVIAFRKGGAIETVKEHETGVFFDEQSVDALIEAVNRFENTAFDRNAIRKNAERFSRNVFRECIKNTIEKKVKINKIEQL
jgi:glycosyltransferase involved in cell wall biosynthesis